MGLMELMQWLTMAVFFVTIVAVVVNKLDTTVAALLGVAVMIWMGIMTEIEASKLVDWNVMAILVGIWIIAGYFGKIRRAELAVGAVAEALRRQPGAAGPGAVDAHRRHLDVRRQRGDDPDDGAGRAAARARARHSGDAARADDRLLARTSWAPRCFIGDLPPQMLHSVAGAEFFDFIWQQGRPSSFPILMVTFIAHARLHVVLRLPQASASRRAEAQPASRPTSRTDCSPPSPSACSC